MPNCSRLETTSPLASACAPLHPAQSTAGSLTHIRSTSVTPTSFPPFNPLVAYRMVLGSSTEMRLMTHDPKKRAEYVTGKSFVALPVADSICTQTTGEECQSGSRS